MAIDEALLREFDPRRSKPVLRLYGWAPPALSLGRFQDAGAVLDLALCRTRGVPVVRRVTGGGVVFHADELTYSIVCSPRHLPAGLDVDGSYRFLNGFLLAFYRGLGLHADYAADCGADAPGRDAAPGGPSSAARLGAPTAFCFAGRERFDILVDERKIGGNAQRRTRDALFQHGSIPLKDRMAEGAAFLRERPHGLEGSVTDLAAQGVSLAEDELKRRLAAAFEGTFGVVLEGFQPPR